MRRAAVGVEHCIHMLLRMLHLLSAAVPWRAGPGAVPDQDFW
jgi:hypothetical protein